MTPLSAKESAAFVKRLKKLIKALNLSAAAVARLCDTKDTTMRSWLLGRNRVTSEGRQTVETALEELLNEVDRQGDAIGCFLGQPPRGLKSV